MSRKSAPTVLGIPTSVFTVGAIALVAMAFSASRGDKMLAIAGAVIFAARLISAANASIMAGAARAALRQSARFNTITMLWGALALLIAYPIVGLKWQHGWQYGLGAALFAAAFAWYAQRLDNSNDPLIAPAALEHARRLSAVLALAVLGVAGWLVLSGKLMTIKNDWLANAVFLAVAASLFAVSVVTFLRARA